MNSAIGKGIAYCKQAKEIIINVFDYFKRQNEYPDDEDSTPLQQTMAATGVKSRTTIYKINKEGPVSPKKKGPKHKPILDNVDEFNRGIIRRIISQMYSDKIWPTVESIYERVQKEINFTGSISTFYNLIKRMGYKYGRRPERKHVKERPDIVAKRHEYLLQIKQVRANPDIPVIYLDETFLHQNHTLSRCWLLDGEGGFKVPSGKGKRIIVVHAGSKNGFVPNAKLIFKSKSNSADYHDEMNGDCFISWFESQLLPNLPPNSCIIMDNASYHSMQEQRIPTMSSLKREMQEWLTQQNIQFDSSMIKPQLYELIKANKPRCIKHVIDELARRHGHYILRLPPYHCELNVIELIWAQIKHEVAVKNSTFKIQDVENLLQTAIGNITPEKWADAEQHVIELEEKLFELEVKIDTTLPEDMLSTFRFHIDNDSDDEFSESEDDDDDDQDDYDIYQFDMMYDEDSEIISESASECSDDDDDCTDDVLVPEFPMWSEA